MHLFYTRWLLLDKEYEIIVDEVIRTEMRKIDPDINFSDYMQHPDSKANISKLLARVLVLDRDLDLGKRLSRYLYRSLYDFCYEIKSQVNFRKAFNFFFNSKESSPLSINKEFISNEIEEGIEFWYMLVDIKSLPVDMVDYIEKSIAHEKSKTGSETKAEYSSLEENFSIKTLRSMLHLKYED